MKKKAHSESQMVSAVKELESGLFAESVARGHGISKATLYNWKSKYSGMDIIERFNGSYRRAVLDAYIFRNLNEAREQTEIWRTYYNEQRPHESLDNMTPIEYRMNKAV